MKDLRDLRVLILESRRAEELIALTSGYGGIPLHAPSMREQKPNLGATIATLERELRKDDVATLVCMTAVGTRQLLKEVVQSPDLMESLRNVPILARDTAVMNVLHSFGLHGIPLPTPHGWAEVEGYLTRHLAPGQQAMVVEYGESLPRLLRRDLEFTGLRVTTLPTCHAAFPFNPGPLAHAVRECVLGGPDVLLLTNGLQLLHFLKYAESIKLLDEARAGLNRLVTVSIGSICTEVAGELGVRVDLQAPQPKFDQLLEFAATHVHPLLCERYPLRRTS